MRKKQNNTAPEQTRELRSGLAAFSLFVFLLDKLADKIYQAICDGFFGKIFTAYSSEQGAFEDGFLKNHFISVKFKLYFRKFRQFLSRSFSSSRVLGRIKTNSGALLSIPLKAYGSAVFAFGLYTVVVFLIRWAFPTLVSANVEYLWTGIVLCVISIPVLLSRDSLARALGKGCITGMLFRDAFGLREETFALKPRLKRSQSNLLLFGGMLLGLLTLFVHPWIILAAITIVILLSVVFSSPEVGVLLSIFLIPFLSFFEHSALLLGILISVTAISYLIKLVCGKRILKFELLDLAIVLFWILLYLSGVISAGGTQGYFEVMLSCLLMLGYFLVVNLMRTEKWLMRCVKALIASGTMVAWFGILQYCLGIFETGNWLDQSYFYDIEGRVVSVFENPNVLGSYLLLVLPFSLYFMVRSQTKKNKLLSWISILSILACTLLTWSRGAWIAALICLLSFALFYTKKTMRVLFGLCFCIPFLPFVLPQSVVRRFTSIGNLADSSTMYRVYTWKGTWRAISDHFMGGVGYGTAAYAEMYPQYAFAGMEAAAHSHSLFLQLWFGMGIFGLLSFLTVIFLSTQMNLEFLKKAKNLDLKWMVLASMCAILSSLIMGLFDFVWYNYRVFYLFWIVLALACACVRVGKAEQRRLDPIEVFDAEDSALDIVLE